MISPLFEKERILKRTAEMAEEITRDYRDKNLLCLILLNGAVFFGKDLLSQIKLDLEMDTLRASSYGNGTHSSGNVRIGELDRDLRGYDVLIVEDIVDSGRTLDSVCAFLEEKGVKSLKTAVLLDKPSRRTVNFKADYVGFEIEDYFVVGYGFDFGGKYRNLEYIGIYQ